jgi:DNA end-binding protein Ku
MTPRHSWKGHLKLSLVAMPIKAYPATTASRDIHFNQLHAACHSRIQYKKVCPRHGEVHQEDIVSGYQFAKGRYVVVDAAELDSVRSSSDKIVRIDAFFAAGELDPLYADAKTYYLLPDGAVAEQAYAVLMHAMRHKQRQAIARLVLNRKEQLFWLRPLDDVLAMTALCYDEQVTKPKAFAKDVPACLPAAGELTLMQTLVDACTPRRFDYALYRDSYTAKLLQLLDAKVSGQAVVTEPVETALPLLNLMEALKKSVAQAQAPLTAAEPVAAPARNGKARSSGKPKKAAARRS